MLKSNSGPSTGPAGSGCCSFSTTLWYSRLPARLASAVGLRSFSTGKKPRARHCEAVVASTKSRDGSASRRRLASYTGSALPPRATPSQAPSLIWQGAS